MRVEICVVGHEDGFEFGVGFPGFRHIALVLAVRGRHEFALPHRCALGDIVEGHAEVFRQVLDLLRRREELFGAPRVDCPHEQAPGAVSLPVFLRGEGVRLFLVGRGQLLAVGAVVAGGGGLLEDADALAAGKGEADVAVDADAGCLAPGLRELQHAVAGVEDLVAHARTLVGDDNAVAGQLEVARHELHEDLVLEQPQRLRLAQVGRAEGLARGNLRFQRRARGQAGVQASFRRDRGEPFRLLAGERVGVGHG